MERFLVSSSNDTRYVIVGLVSCGPDSDEDEWEALSVPYSSANMIGAQGVQSVGLGLDRVSLMRIWCLFETSASFWGQ